MKKINILDCTLRDGGYYNNWVFKKSVIQEYLYSLSKTKIEFIEIGFFTLNKKNNLGSTANVDKNFFKNLKIPSNLNIGIMINASEILKTFDNHKKTIKRLHDIDFKNTKFIRIACHISEYAKILKFILFFKRKKIQVFINIMQISEVSQNDIKLICKKYNKVVSAIYIADSFGSLKPVEISKIIKNFKKYTKTSIGIHAHDNMGYALKNSIQAKKLGAEWFDATILGMGRGPGNTKTEKILNNKNFNLMSARMDKQKIYKYFIKLKKKYKWGNNKFYKFSGKNKIHPTYVQMLLGDQRINKENYLQILKNIRTNNAKKYDPNELQIASYLFKNQIQEKSLINKNIFSNYKKAILINSNYNLRNLDKKMKNIFNDSNIVKVLVNDTASTYLRKNCDLIAICHPLRLMTIKENFDKFYNKILIPYENIPNQIKTKLKKDKLINFPLKIKSDIRIFKNSVSMPEPLALIYAISFLISAQIYKIDLLGFYGYKKSDPFQDNSKKYLNKIIKKFKKVSIKSVNETNLI